MLGLWFKLGLGSAKINRSESNYIISCEILYTRKDSFDKNNDNLIGRFYGDEKI